MEKGFECNKEKNIPKYCLKCSTEKKYKKKLWKKS